MLKLQDRSVVGRYAQALFGAAQKAQAVDEVRRDLGAFQDMLTQFPDLRVALRHPRLPSQTRRDLLALVGKAMSPLTVSFLTLLLQKKRWDALPEVAGIYNRLADQLARVLSVGVVSPAPLSSLEVDSVRRHLEKAWGNTVSLKASVDEKLLGGLVLRVGDRVWDNSLRGQLERLRERMLAGSAA